MCINLQTSSVGTWRHAFLSDQLITNHLSRCSLPGLLKKMTRNPSRTISSIYKIYNTFVQDNLDTWNDLQIDCVWTLVPNEQRSSHAVSYKLRQGMWLYAPCDLTVLPLSDITKAEQCRSLQHSNSTSYTIRSLMGEWGDNNTTTGYSSSLKQMGNTAKISA